MATCKLVSISEKPILFVITGSKKDVFKNTGVMKRYYSDLYADFEKFIVTDESNIDIFYNLPNTNLYPMNAETFLILDQMFFGKMLLIPNTELSNAFCKKLSKRNTSIAGVITQHEFDSWEYTYIPVSHPIDIAHSRIKRKGKYLVGINIGENEHVTKKLPYSFLCDLMNNIASKIRCRFVLFGTSDNALRAEMLKRECHQDLIMMIGDYTTEIFAQAISLCDCFISLNRFLLHLSLAIEQVTIGLFYNDEFVDNEENEDTLVNLIPFVIEGKCGTCDDNKECECVYSDDHYCLNDLKIKDICDMAVEIVKSKDK